MEKVRISIDVQALPASAIMKADNGKKYIIVEVTPRREETDCFPGAMSRNPAMCSLAQAPLMASIRYPSSSMSMVSERALSSHSRFPVPLRIFTLRAMTSQSSKTV